MNGLFALNEVFSSQGKVGSPNVTQPKSGYHSDISPTMTFSIYIKAVEEVKSLVEKCREDVVSYNKALKSGNNKDAVKQQQLKIVQNNLKAQEIVTSFIKAFSIASSEKEEPTYSFFHEYFSFIYYRLELFNLKFDTWHLRNLEEICEEIKTVFAEMQDEYRVES